MKSWPCHQAPCIRYTVIQHTPLIIESPWNGIYSSIVGVQRGQLRGFLSDNQPQLCPVGLSKASVAFLKEQLERLPRKGHRLDLIAFFMWPWSLCSSPYSSRSAQMSLLSDWAGYVIVQPKDKGRETVKCMQGQPSCPHTHSHTHIHDICTTLNGERRWPSSICC